MSSILNRVGETNTTHQGFIMTIIKYESSRNVIIQFNDRHNTIWHTTYQRFKYGHVENPSVLCMHGRIIYKEDIIDNPIAYNKYRGMLDRCYGIQKGHNVVYQGCEVCKEWSNFENFLVWFNDNYYSIDDNMDLDKDILGNGKLYSPDTCVFIPHKLNSQFARRNNTKFDKDLPMGVTRHKRQGGSVCYRVVVLPHNQLFNDINEAENAYKQYVKAQYKEFAITYKDIIPQRLYEKLVDFEK